MKKWEKVNKKQMDYFIDLYDKNHISRKKLIEMLNTHDKTEIRKALDEVEIAAKGDEFQLIYPDNRRDVKKSRGIE